MLKFFKKKIKLKLKSAFTLAEVLITLGIIGVIAAIVIPTLMNKVQQIEFKTAAKKEYSIISQAYSSILSDNSGSLAGVCASAADQRNCFTDLFKAKMKYSKVCYNNDDNYAAGGDKACFVKQIYNYDGTSQYSSAGRDGGLVLNDGTTLWLVLWYPNCDNSVKDELNIIRGNFCGFIAFDINGLKKPNAWGKDIYAVGVYSNKLSPYNAGNTYFGSSYLYDVINNIDY